MFEHIVRLVNEDTPRIIRTLQDGTNHDVIVNTDTGVTVVASREYFVNISIGAHVIASHSA